MLIVLHYQIAEIYQVKMKCIANISSTYFIIFYADINVEITFIENYLFYCLLTLTWVLNEFLFKKKTKK